MPQTVSRLCTTSAVLLAHNTVTVKSTGLTKLLYCLMSSRTVQSRLSFLRIMNCDVLYSEDRIIVRVSVILFVSTAVSDVSKALVLFLNLTCRVI
jgi:hypothetical protein